MDKCARCRKFGSKLFLKGGRCLAGKCALTRRNYQPGQHGSTRKTAPRKSEYGLQLLEKQKAKAEYGLRDRQFSKIFHEAAKSRENTGAELLKLLEMRLDNVIYRLGWTSTRAQARQLVTHRKVKVNGRVLNIPSYVTKIKDKIEPVKKEAFELQKVELPKWISAGKDRFQAEITGEPEREQIETDINEQLIIEFYSR